MSFLFNYNMRSPSVPQDFILAGQDASHAASHVTRSFHSKEIFSFGAVIKDEDVIF